MANNCGCKCYRNPESEDSYRNLIVCIDGTANQFGKMNTNVIELYHLIEKDENHRQLTWYNSGIGTYARPSWKSLKYYRQVIDHKIDLAIAWNFERTILAAYEWLSENYRNGDRIFLFGFSRGAFQVRVLAAMIDKVGLIYKGNAGQIPFAYELYADPKSGEPSEGVFDVGFGPSNTKPLSLLYGAASNTDVSMAGRFKRAFSHDNVTVHFVGAWDTVSSIGLVRGKYMLPGTVDGMTHVCYFRHALALDERRVKFAPEYAYGGSATAARTLEDDYTQTQYRTQDTPPQVLEVWFRGTHSDIGGGNISNEAMNRSAPPLRWMVYEAREAGLRTKNFVHLLMSDTRVVVKESLKGIWWILELLPLNRLTYTRRNGGKQETYKPHMGAARKIHFGQKIHGSLIASDEEPWKYTPQVLLHVDLPWDESSTRGLRTYQWLAFDLFEHTLYLLYELFNGKKQMVVEDLVEITLRVDGLQAVYTAALQVLLRNCNPVPDWRTARRFDFMWEVMRILENNNPHSTPLTKVHFSVFKQVLGDCRDIDIESYMGDRFISIAQRFLYKFISWPRLALEGNAYGLSSVAIFPNGEQFASVLKDVLTIRVWSTMTGQQIRDIKSRFPVSLIAISPDGKIIASGSSMGVVCLWNAGTGKIATQVSERTTQSATSLAFSDDSRYIASGFSDETVCVWDINSGEKVGDDLNGNGIPIAIKFTDLARIHIVWCPVSVTSFITAEVRDVKTKKTVGKPVDLWPGQESFVSAAFSSDETYVALGLEDGCVQVSDLKNSTTLRTSRIHSRCVRSVAFSSAKKWVVSASEDGIVKILSIKYSEKMAVEGTYEHAAQVDSALFFPDGKSLLSSSYDGTIRLWDVEPW